MNRFSSLLFLPVRAFLRQVALLCGMLLLLGSAQAQKNCSYTGGATQAAQFAFTLPATITLNGNEATGAVLWQSPTLSPPNVQLSCPFVAGTAGLIGLGGSTTTSAGAYNVMPTGIPGIGYAIRQSYWSNGIVGYPNNQDYGWSSSLSNSLIFVRTSGTLPSRNTPLAAQSPLATWYVGSNKIALAAYNTTATLFKFPGGSTCKTADVTVPMQTWGMGQMKAVGSTGPATAFNLNLSECPAEIKSISVQFTPVTAQLATGASDFALNGTSTARGVGIRIMNGADVPLALNTNHNMNYVSGSGGLSFPMKAVYVKSNAAVTPGTANSSLTFTMTYQ